MARIFNGSFESGKIPDDLKIAKVIPIYKNGDLSLVSNYRPISILPCFSKILERLVANRMYNFVEKYNILSPTQYGFRANYSTHLALIDLIDKISSSLDKSLHTIGLFLDLSKAFNTIDHNILISKLNKYRIRGIALDWFKNYLSDRKQYVVWQETKSSFAPIRCGVPQGSILGPILFLIYINDICNSSKTLSFILFADDTNVFHSSNNLLEAIDTVNRQLCKISEWFNNVINYPLIRKRHNVCCSPMVR